MECIFREGALRIHTSEASCDVILSCQGRRLMAHKIMLSIASPLLKELLKEDLNREIATLVIPDVSSNTMSLILDYIYTGSVTLYSNTTLDDFITAARLLELHLDLVHKDSKKQDVGNVFSRRNWRKMPELRPIISKETQVRNRIKRAPVMPKCPWTQRTEQELPDPRNYLTAIKTKPDQDVNNNLHSENDDSVENLRVKIATESDHLLEQKTSGNESDNKNCQEIAKCETKTDNKPFKCDECGKCFSQLRNFKYHRSIHEGTKEFAAACPECGKTFNDRGYLSSHMKIHRDKKEYACPHCPKRFNQRVAYNMHLRIHTGLKPHQCPTCDKSFSRKMLLKQHQRVHTGERPYSCPECGKTFADRSNMSLHARLHTGVKPYACEMCSKSFTKKHHLKTHMNFHTGLKPYSCKNCGLAFSQSSNMRTHYKKCMLKINAENTDSNSSFTADN